MQMNILGALLRDAARKLMAKLIYVGESLRWGKNSIEKKTKKAGGEFQRKKKTLRWKIKVLWHIWQVNWKGLKTAWTGIVVYNWLCN